MSDSISEIVRLLKQVRPLQPDPIRLVGATEEDIARFEREFGTRVPSELREWLSTCNGAPVNPGSLYGLSGSPGISIDWYFREYPHWVERSWWPVAGDGCGDLYVLDASIVVGTNATHPVVFLDQSDFDNAAYVVASSLVRFLYFLLESELRGDRDDSVYWPMDRDVVTRRDPEIERTGLTLPWDY